MKEQWRQQMQEKLADYRQSAPEVSWEKIDKALTSNKPKAKAPIKREKNDACISSSEREVVRPKVKAVPMWMRRIAAAVAVLVVATAGYLALDRNHEELSRGDGFDNPVSSANGITQFATPHSQRENPPHHPESQQTKVEPVVVKAKTHQTTAKAVEVQEEPPTPQPQEMQPQETRESQEPRHTHSVVETPKRQTLDEPSVIRQQTPAGSRLMAKVYLSNGLAGSNSSIRDFGYLGEHSNNHGKSEPTGQTQYYNNNSTNLTHHQPVRLGLSLRYRLNDRWSIESGLAYTRLRSDLKWRSGQEAEQTLSYVGIPVNANYLLWGSRYVNFYVSAGGMVEKMVKGSLYTTAKGKEQSESISIHPLQFSVNGGIGAEFNLTNQFSIYAEPGLGYYFDNGSDVRTYYQDKPFSFNLNLGLRFNIK